MHQHKDGVDIPALACILIIRLSSRGDILLTTPILRLLRTHYPVAQSDFLTSAILSTAGHVSATCVSSQKSVQ